VIRCCCIEVLRRRRRREVVQLRSVLVKCLRALLGKGVPYTGESPDIDGQVVMKLTFGIRVPGTKTRTRRENKVPLLLFFFSLHLIKLLLSFAISFLLFGVSKLIFSVSYIFSWVTEFRHTSLSRSI
jgi:hypothetical protein